jgi:hypothetical protein
MENAARHFGQMSRLDNLSADFLMTVAALRGCDFFDFSQKATLKTTGLDAKKSSYPNKVTSSQNDG